MTAKHQPHRPRGDYDATDAIRVLLGSGLEGAAPLEPDQWKRTLARVAWIRETMARLRNAQERADEAWARLIEPYANLDDDEFDDLDLPEPPEQAEWDAIYAQIRAVIDHGHWPRELYWSGI